MSCFGPKKSLRPSKKVNRWNGFTSLLQNIQQCKPIRKVLSVVLRRPVRPTHRLRHKKPHAKKVYYRAPVYVDELFRPEPVPALVECIKPPSIEKSVKAEMVGSSPGASGSRMAGELNEVDVKAEMFIQKFREEMRLQRQGSFGEYQEMLARGV